MIKDDKHNIAVIKAACEMRNILHPTVEGTDKTIVDPEFAIAFHKGLEEYNKEISENLDAIDKAYVIWDSREQKYWTSGTKKLWSKSAHAKSAIMYRKSTLQKNLLPHEILKLGGYSNNEVERFDDQSRYECWEIHIVKKKKV